MKDQTEAPAVSPPPFSEEQQQWLQEHLQQLRQQIVQESVKACFRELNELRP